MGYTDVHRPQLLWGTIRYKYDAKTLDQTKNNNSSLQYLPIPKSSLLPIQRWYLDPHSK